MSAEGEGRAGELARAIIDRFFVLTRNLGVHGAAHPLVHQNAEGLAEALDAVGPPYAIQFVRDAVFVDRELAVLDPPNFLRARRLAASLAALKVNELRVEYAPAAASLVAVADAVARRVPLPSVDGMLFREIDGAQAGTEAMQVDTELFAAAQLLRALVEVEGVHAAGLAQWPWPVGISVVRRVERAKESDLDACLRFIDHAPGDRGAPRRALAAAVHALSLGGAARLGLPLRRVLAHAALALTQYGDEGGPVNVRDAAARALPAMVASIGATRAALDPHRMRVCAVLQSLLDGGEAHPLAAPLHLAYTLERAQAVGGAGFWLLTTDLLAWAARLAGRRLDAGWVHALLCAYGVVPPNARVRALEGGEGIALGGAPDDTPLQPLVLLRDDGSVLAPAVPVRLATEMEV